MKERGIIMSGENPALILDGSKTETRRIMNPQPEKSWERVPEYFSRTLQRVLRERHGQAMFTRPNRGGIVIRCPYGQPGDILYVRETHYRFGRWKKNGKTKTGRQAWKFDGSAAIQFGPPDIVMLPKQRGFGWYKRPAIFMPKWIARIRLEITSVRAEQLQDITEEGAKAEGMRNRHDVFHTAIQSAIWNVHTRNYAVIWESINGNGSWNRNPFIFVIAFKKL